MTLRTLQRDYMKIMILHGRIFMLYSQLIFSILTHFQCAHNVNNFLISVEKGFKKNKKGFWFPGFYSEVLLISFYVSLFMFEEIFCWIAWVTFRWIVVLFSFRFNSYKTNYIWKECKKMLRTSHWLNNVSLQLISRLPF